MNLRHIRAFVAVAEELHFGRAAKRLHIEQSPLSRTIRKMETELGLTLLQRTPRGVSLTPAGRTFLEDAYRILLAVEQAQARARATAKGHQGTLRIGLTGDIGWTKLSALLALCRQEAPQMSVRLSEVPLSQLLNGLSADLFDAGFSTTGGTECEIEAMPIWQDRFVVAVPARHPLLSFKEVPMNEVVNHRLVLCDPQACEGCSSQRDRLFRAIEKEPDVAEYVSTHTLMMSLVAAGYGVGLSSEGHLVAPQQAEVVTRPLAEPSAVLTTYLLRAKGEAPEPLRQFIDRAQRVGCEGVDV